MDGAVLPNTSSRSESLQADDPWSAYQPQAIGGATPPVIDLSSGVLAESGQHDEGAVGLAGSASDSGPSFDPTTERNVTVLVGRTAHLHCRVRNLANRTVSETTWSSETTHRS